MKLAFAYRQRFRREVFIDLVCYRQHGHNELGALYILHTRIYSILYMNMNMNMYCSTLMYSTLASPRRRSDVHSAANVPLDPRAPLAARRVRRPSRRATRLLPLSLSSTCSCSSFCVCVCVCVFVCVQAEQLTTRDELQSAVAVWQSALDEQLSLVPTYVPEVRSAPLDVLYSTRKHE